jgi:hypothetical protein
MTDRHMGYVVVLDENLREDDAAHVIAALQMIKGVASVTPVTADFTADVITAQRRDDQWRRQIYELVGRMPDISSVSRQA